MRTRARVDRNHRQLVRVLEQLGWLVDQTHGAGRGMSDAVCSRGGITRLVEFKGPKGKLTPAQVTFHARHDVRVLRTEADCEALR